MSTSSEATDAILLSVDPMRGFQRFRRDLDRLTDLDPKIREARSLVEQHLRALPSDTDFVNTLTPLLWLQVRNSFQNQQVLGIVCEELGNGDKILRSVEDAIATTLSHDVLLAAIAETTALAQPESLSTKRLQLANDELGHSESTFNFDTGDLALAGTIVVIVVIVVILGPIIFA